MEILFKSNPIHTSGELPQIGKQAPNFSLTGNDLKDYSLTDYSGKRIILNIFPSIDTGICAMSVRFFNSKISELPNAIVLCISKDLPFAQKRFCGAEGIDNAITLADYKNNTFSQDYGTVMIDGPLAGLHSRAVVVIDENGKIIYTEQVPEITEEPKYEKVLELLK